MINMKDTRTLTVRELKAKLEVLDPDIPVYFETPTDAMEPDLHNLGRIHNVARYFDNRPTTASYPDCAVIH